MQAALRWRQLSSINLPISTKAEAVSAGTEPGLRVHPEVLAAMQEVGIDLSDAKPQKLTQELAERRGIAHHYGLWRQMPLRSRLTPGRLATA